MSQEQQNNGMSEIGGIILGAGILMAAIAIFSGHYILGGALGGVAIAISKAVSKSDNEKKEKKGNKNCEEKRIGR